MPRQNLPEHLNGEIIGSAEYTAELCRRELWIAMSGDMECENLDAEYTWEMMLKDVRLDCDRIAKIWRLLDV